MPIVICQNPNCIVEFYVKPSALKKGNGKYCSLKCRSGMRTIEKENKQNTVCAREGCDSKYYIIPSKKAKGLGKYCSHKCYSLDKIGKPLSDEHKNNIGKATKQMWKDGVFDAPYIRKIYSKQGKSTRGSKRTEEQKRALSERMKGKDVSHLHTPEARAKSLDARKGMIQSSESNRKRSQTLKGRIFSDEHRKKLSVSGRKRDKSTYLYGEDNPNWRGGISKERVYSNEFRQKKKEIRLRDNKKCKICGLELGDTFGVIHHIDANKSNNDDNNLLLVCRTCHGKIHAKRRVNNPIIMSLRKLLKY